jgi:hypothetical protein
MQNIAAICNFTLECICGIGISQHILYFPFSFKLAYYTVIAWVSNCCTSWRSSSSVMWCYVIGCIVPDVLKDPSAFIFRLKQTKTAWT